MRQILRRKLSGISGVTDLTADVQTLRADVTAEVREVHADLAAAVRTMHADLAATLRAGLDAQDSRHAQHTQGAVDATAAVAQRIDALVAQNLSASLAKLQDLQSSAFEESQRMRDTLASISAATELVGTQTEQVVANHAWLAEVLDDALAGATVNVPDSMVKPKIRIHFLFQMPETWTSWASLWRACVESPYFDPLLVLLPFEHDSAIDAEKPQRFLEAQGLSFVRADAYDLAVRQPDVIVIQNPYDSTRPPQFHMEVLVRNNVRVIYVPYGLDVGGGVENLRWQYDLDVHQKAWRVFARSVSHKKMFSRYCSSGDAHVVVTGHPKIDAIVRPRLQGSAIGAPPESDVAQHRHVLWTPHFSVNEGGWSTYLKYAESMLAYFESKPVGLSLIIRPHPLLFGRLKQLGMLDDDGIASLRKRFDQPPYIYFDENEQYDVSFERSSCLIADAGSFLLEYLATEKPILYLHNADGPGLNASGAFTENYYQASRFDDIESFMTMVASGDDPKREQRLDQVNPLLHRIDGKIGDAIAEHVAKSFYDEVLEDKKRRLLRINPVNTYNRSTI